MAKPTFNKLKLKPIINQNQLKWEDQIITINDYLPIEKKLNLVADVINNAKDENNFRDEGKIDVYYNLSILYYYTDLTFTDKQKQDPGKMYDSVITTGFMDKILEQIPDKELEFLRNILDVSIDDYYGQRNSIKGLLESAAADYSNINLDATAIQKKLADPDNLKLLKGVMGELG